MTAKFDEYGNRFARLSVFVPDIGGPRALPVDPYAPMGTGRCSCTASGARCFRCSTPHWSR